ncbi:MAG: type II toxin-antitoxin system ParD family antitoxin [Planctomycetes bacterium]|nr:type II toxin-antitoxin system ParD family antitoxin [Planctomycetota bacterium]MBU4400562.1 type II toxin-antitoxin system ParD family antitoxin [Planctomycetota bacterium]MCG2682922.1 type II toxin-antitoxin system ParD family antitoxin [Planctomycetales bacterium]
MIDQSLPPELVQFVEEQVASGHYRSEQDLLVSAVRVLRSVQDRQRQFREDVRLGMEQLERGEFNEYDEDGLRKRFEELKQQAVDRAKNVGGVGQ